MGNTQVYAFFLLHRYTQGDCQVKAWQSPRNKQQNQERAKGQQQRVKGRKQVGQGPVVTVKNKAEQKMRKGAPAWEQPQEPQPVEW